MDGGVLERGLAHHRAGRMSAAVACYRAVLAAAPGQADARHLLGLALHQSGDTAGARAALTEACRLRPEEGLYAGNLGRVCLAAGDAAAAVVALRQAVAAAPAESGLWHDFGLALLRAGAAGEAERALRQCLARDPAAADARINLAAALLAQGRAEAAEAELLAVLAAQPGSVAALCGHAAALAALGRYGASVAQWRAALDLRPGDAGIAGNLGNALRLAGRLDAAIVVLAPIADDADGLNNLGLAYSDAGRLAEAIGAFDAALAVAPGHADAAYNRATALLLGGQWRAGWPGFEQRWERRGFAAPWRIAVPRWRGEATGDRVLLLHAEQGLGDTIMMARFLPMLARRHRIVLAVPRTLVGLLAPLVPGVRLCASEDGLPDCDLQCPLMSLPAVLDLDFAGLPGEMPYLVAEVADAQAWRARLAGLPGRRVGLAWAGNPAYGADAARSLPAADLAALAGVAGVSFVSLQPGVAPPPCLAMADWTAELPDFAATAALVAGLDMVISVDTAVAHLAGALGRPVWLLNRFAPCWRWELGRADSPWYPTLLQFRQPAPGDWASVVAAVRVALDQAPATA